VAQWLQVDDTNGDLSKWLLVVSEYHYIPTLYACVPKRIRKTENKAGQGEIRPDGIKQALLGFGSMHHIVCARQRSSVREPSFCSGTLGPEALRKAKFFLKAKGKKEQRTWHARVVVVFSFFFQIASASKGWLACSAKPPFGTSTASSVRLLLAGSFTRPDDRSQLLHST
jgi:hypothetical protein